MSARMNRVMRVFIIFTVVLSGAVLASCTPPGPGGGTDSDGSGPVSGSADGVVTALFVDISPSARPLRVPGGEFEKAAADTTTATAVDQGTLYAAQSSENTVGNSTWEVEEDFVPTIESNAGLSEAELTKKAEEVVPQVEKVVHETGAGGSDLFGALQKASRLFSEYEGRDHALVFLTDGDVNASDFHLNKELPLSTDEIDGLVQQLISDGAIPQELSSGTEPVQVYMDGLGYGIDSPEKSQDIVEFWEALIPAIGGELNQRLPEPGSYP